VWRAVPAPPCCPTYFDRSPSSPRAAGGDSLLSSFLPYPPPAAALPPATYPRSLPLRRRRYRHPVLCPVLLPLLDAATLRRGRRIVAGGGAPIIRSFHWRDLINGYRLRVRSDLSFSDRRSLLSYSLLSMCSLSSRGFLDRATKRHRYRF